ncbi:hypothetical protein CEXT_272341 [Caerostris extrusa]|uniref:Uncharacterized protein n=1 Tax=Caerostris extrusa TaxID=172846 RepID=A0AAV4SYQ3_CAEEX|nr:hypothetical protein CEXT_272341 [Caerostris extrusa]
MKLCRQNNCRRIIFYPFSQKTAGNGNSNRCSVLLKGPKLEHLLMQLLIGSKDGVSEPIEMDTWFFEVKEDSGVSKFAPSSCAAAVIGKNANN